MHSGDNYAPISGHLRVCSPHGAHLFQSVYSRVQHDLCGGRRRRGAAEYQRRRNVHPGDGVQLRPAA
eukprot:3166502-Pyramimonas_sp.AAC.1